MHRPVGRRIPTFRLIGDIDIADSGTDSTYYSIWKQVENMTSIIVSGRLRS
jgi:hypothetical protein